MTKIRDVKPRLADKDDPIFTGKTTISSHQSPEPYAPEWTLETANSERWHFKAMENMQMHLAYWDAENGNIVLFTNTMGHVFDEVVCSSSEEVKELFAKHRFRRCVDDKEFMRLFGHPLQIEKHQYYQESFYSS
jgi:hypothetical protein